MATAVKWLRREGLHSSTDQRVRVVLAAMSEPVGYLVGQHGELSGLRLAIPEAGLVICHGPNEADVVLEDRLVSRRHARQVEMDKQT